MNKKSLYIIPYFIMIWLGYYMFKFYEDYHFINALLLTIVFYTIFMALIEFDWKSLGAELEN